MKEELLKTGSINSKYDNAIFYWHQNNRSQGILSPDVDDFFGQVQNVVNRCPGDLICLTHYINFTE